MGSLAAMTPILGALDLGTAATGMSYKPNFGPTNSYMNAQSGNIQQLGNLQNQYAGEAQQQAGQYNNAQNNLNNSTQQLQQLYNANPYTDAYSTGQISNATSGMDANFQRANANAEAQNANAGGAGAPNSNLSGAQNYINAGAAGNISQMQNQLSQQAIAQRRQNLQSLQGMNQGLAQNYYGNTQSAMGAQTGLINNQMQGNANLANTSFNMAMGPYQQAMGNVQAGLGGLGSLAGFNAMSGMYGSMNPQTPTSGIMDMSRAQTDPSMQGYQYTPPTNAALAPYTPQINTGLSY